VIANICARTTHVEQYLFGALIPFRNGAAERHTMVGRYITAKCIQPTAAELVSGCSHFSKNDFAYV